MAKPKPVGFEVRKSAPFKGKEWRVTGYKDGQRKQYWFATEREAKADAADRNREMQAYGSTVNLDSEARLEAFRAAELLRPHGKTILDAVRHYLNYLSTLSASVPVAEMFETIRMEFARRLSTEEASLRHYTSMMETLKKFEATFGSRQVATLTAVEIKGWLASLPLAVKTRNRHLGYLKNAFGIAQKELAIISVNPLDTAEAFKNPKAEKIEILSVDEMSRFLSALDKDWLPFFAISSFTGLRRAEVERLDWSEIKLDRNLIDLPAYKSKNRRRKLEEIPENLRDILTPFLRTEGEVKPPRKKLQYALETACAAAAIHWSQNCLRHSFCSYAVATKGLDWTAIQADHDTRMLKKNYWEVVEKKQAELYWAIRPRVEEGLRGRSHPFMPQE